MTISQSTGENIRKIRSARGMTMDALAEKIHKSKSTLSKYEHGTVEIGLETLHEIARVLEVPVYSLLPPADTASAEKLTVKIPSFQHHSDRSSQLKLWLYFIGGANNNVRKSLLEIDRFSGYTLVYVDPYNKNSTIGCSFFYQGMTSYVDSKYRIIVHNHYNEHDIFAMQWNDAMSGSHTLMGLLVHFSAGGFPAFSTNCLLSDTELPVDGVMLKALQFTRQDVADIKKRNAIYSSSRPQAYDAFWKF